MKIDSYLSGFLLVGASTIVSVVGLLVVRRLLHSKNLISSHDVGGYLLSVVGTMYAVILGLIVVDAMGKFQEARQTTEQRVERPGRRHPPVQPASAGASGPGSRRSRWPTSIGSSRTSGRSSTTASSPPSARHAAIDLIDAVCGFDPKTNKEQAIYAAEVEALCEFWNSRRTRINTAAHGLPALEWFVLIVGGSSPSRSPTSSSWSTCGSRSS